MATAGQPTALIFDFDGTLVDSFLLSLNILYQLVHHAPLPVEDVSQLRDLSPLRLLRQIHVSPLQAVLLRRRAYHVMAGDIDQLELVPGISKTLQALAKYYPLYIVSANDTVNVEAALEHFGLEHYIHGVVGEANPLNKARALRRLAQRYNLDRGQTWYIGDQPGDVRAAHRAGMRAVAVSWGFSNIHRLETAHPDHLVFTPEELTAQFTKRVIGHE